MISKLGRQGEMMKPTCLGESNGGSEDGGDGEGLREAE